MSYFSYFIFFLVCLAWCHSFILSCRFCFLCLSSSSPLVYLHNMSKHFYCNASHFHIASCAICHVSCKNPPALTLISQKKYMFTCVRVCLFTFQLLSHLRTISSKLMSLFGSNCNFSFNIDIFSHYYRHCFKMSWFVFHTEHSKSPFYFQEKSYRRERERDVSQPYNTAFMNM